MIFSDKVDSDSQPAQDAPLIQRFTRRSIRSFVIRAGRMTAAQSSALERLGPKFGIPYTDSLIDPDRVFQRSAPTWLEIGFGNGDVLLHMAHHHPDVNIIGAEVHEAGIGHALLGVERLDCDNIRYIQHDAVEVLQHMLPPNSLDKVLLLFPDPWHKKRHHKRRIVQTEFLDAVAATLKPSGILHCATDWADYAQWMIERLELDERFTNCAEPGCHSPRPEWRPITHFERRGHKLGHEVADLLYRRH